MPITTVIIISLLFLNLCLTLIMFWALHSTLEATKSLQDSNDLVKNSFEVCGESIENYSKASKSLMDSYENILKAYEVMRKQYDSIVNMNTKLLECWKVCEERYSQSYEQFKHCSDQLKEVSFQLTDLANTSTEDEYYLTLQEACDTVCCDCPHDQCLTGNCPVWQLKNKDSEFLNSLGELVKEKGNKDIQEGTDDYEWTENDYRDAVNTHPEDIQEGSDDAEHTTEERV